MKIKIAGLRQVVGLTQLEVFSLPISEIRSRILASLAENGINLEFVVAHAHPDKTADLVLGIRRNQKTAALGLLQGLREKYNLEALCSRDPMGMISLFPHGQRATVIGNFLSAFRDARIPLLSLSFSLSAVSALIEESSIPEALSALSEYFELPG